MATLATEPTPNGEGPKHGKGGKQARALALEILRSDWAFLRRVADLFPWRPLGIVLTGAAYAALEWLAFARLDLVWLVLAYVALGMAAVCPLAVLLAAAWLKWRGGPVPTHASLVLETGVAGPTGYSLPSLRWVPLVGLRWTWETPRGPVVETRARRGRLEEWVCMHDRGQLESIERRVLVEDPFGLCRVAVRLRETVEVDVLPRLAGLRHLPPLSAFASGDALSHPLGLEDGDRVELQRYTPGDPARWIHWKVLARTRRLMVRLPERALSPARRMAAYLAAGPDDDASAALARLALERALLGGEWCFGTDADPTPTSRVDAAMATLVRSAAFRGQGGVGLPAFVERVAARGPASLLVFCPPRPGPWLDRVADVARRRELRAVVGVDGLARTERPRFWQRLFWFWAEPIESSSDALEEVVWKLGDAGVEVIVIDRASGMHLTAAHRDAMRRFDVPRPEAAA